MSDDIQAKIDRLTMRSGTVFITQYPGGFVDVTAVFNKGVVLFTERLTHESVSDALDDIQRQYDTLMTVNQPIGGQ